MVRFRICFGKFGPCARPGGGSGCRRCFVLFGSAPAWPRSGGGRAEGDRGRLFVFFLFGGRGGSVGSGHLDGGPEAATVEVLEAFSPCLISVRHWAGRVQSGVSLPMASARFPFCSFLRDASRGGSPSGCGCSARPCSRDRSCMCIHFGGESTVIGPFHVHQVAMRHPMRGTVRGTAACMAGDRSHVWVHGMAYGECDMARAWCTASVPSVDFRVQVELKVTPSTGAVVARCRLCRWTSLPRPVTWCPLFGMDIRSPMDVSTGLVLISMAPPAWRWAWGSP